MYPFLPSIRECNHTHDQPPGEPLREAAAPDASVPLNEAPDDNPHIPPPDDEVSNDGELPANIAGWSEPRPPMRMLQRVYLAIMVYLASVRPEAGGMLLGPKGIPIVTEFVIDKHGKATGASFTLDAKGLNCVLKKALACGLDCKGFVHSHPAGCTHPSTGDLLYVRKAFANEKNKDLTEFLLPIFCDGILIPYVIRPREESIVQVAQLILI